MQSPRSFPTRRSSLAVGTVGALASLIGACAPGGVSLGPAPSKSAISDIQAWYTVEGRFEWLDAALTDFNASRGSELRIRWTQQADPSRLVQTLMITIAAGGGFPDIVDLDQSFIGRILRLPDIPLVAFNDRLKGADRDFIGPAFSEPWSKGGRFYALGNELNVALFGYRHDIWTSTRIRAPLTVWDDVIAAGKRVITNSPDGLFYLRADPAGTHLTMSTQAGGGYVAPGGRLQIDHPANVRTLEFLSDLVFKHGVASLLPYDRPGGNREGGDMIGAVAKASFNSGRVAGDIGPMSRLSGQMRLDAPDTFGKWMVQPLPRWTGMSHTPPSVTSGGTGVGVMKHSPDVDIATDFALWAHTTQAVLHDFDKRQTWPVNRRLFDEPRLGDRIAWFHDQPIGQVLRDATTNLVPCIQGAYWPEISRVLAPALKAVLHQQRPVREVLAEAQDAARASVTQAGGNPD